MTIDKLRSKGDFNYKITSSKELKIAIAWQTESIAIKVSEMLPQRTIKVRIVLTFNRGLFQVIDIIPGRRPMRD